MNEKVIIQNVDLAGRALIVPASVLEDGKLILDKEGKAELNEKAAAFMCGVPGFKLIQKLEKPHDEDDKTEKDSARLRQTDFAGQDDGSASSPLYPEGDPNKDWKQKELAAWLTEKKIEFKPKEGKEVLLGKAFKFLEESKSQDGTQLQEGSQSENTNKEEEE